MELAILLGVGFGILHHALNLFLGQSGAGLDGDVGFLAGVLVLGRDMQDAVGIDVESDLDLRHAARRRRNAFQVELAQRLVLARHFALALQHMDGHCGLVILGGGKHLRRLGGNRGVALDQGCHHPTHGLDAQGERGHVQQQHIAHITGQHAGLDGGTDGHCLVGIHVPARFLAEEALDRILHPRHACLAAHQDDLVDVGSFQTRIFQRQTARLDGALDEIFHQGFELGTRQLQIEMLGTAGVRRDIGQVELGLLARGQLDLGLLRCLFQALHGQGILAQIHAVFFLELAGQIIDDAQVEIFSAQEGVPVGGQHLELVLALDLGDLDDRDIKGAAAQIVDHDLAVAALLVHAIGKRRRGRLVDDAFDLQPGDATGVLGGLALGVVEIGRHGDHRLGDGFAQVILGGLLHLAQHLRGDFLWRHLAATGLDPGIPVIGGHNLEGRQMQVFLHDCIAELAADQALDGMQRVLRIGDGLALGGLPDQDFTVLGVGDDGRRGTSAFAVFQHFGLAALQHRHARVGGAQVNADDLAHGLATPKNPKKQKLRYPQHGDGRNRFQCPKASAARSARHDHHGGPDQPIVQGITLLHDVQNRVFRRLGGFLHGNSRMPLGIKHLPLRRDFAHAEFFQGRAQHAERQLHALAQGLGSGLLRAGGRQAQFQAVLDR